MINQNLRIKQGRRVTLVAVLLGAVGEPQEEGEEVEEGEGEEDSEVGDVVEASRCVRVWH